MAELFGEVCQYNTIGLHRSALLAFHNPVQCIKIGNHPRFCNRMAGVFNQRPSQPSLHFKSFSKKQIIDHGETFQLSI